MGSFFSSDVPPPQGNGIYILRHVFPRRHYFGFDIVTPISSYHNVNIDDNPLHGDDIEQFRK